MRVVRAGAELTETAVSVFSRSLVNALAEKSRVSLALSGGKTPWPVLRSLARANLDWDRIDIYQVDERVAPAGDPDLNFTGLISALLSHVPAKAYPMPVNESDLEAAAERYEVELPDVLDVVHLGLGEDGHTASLVPGDPVLDVTDRRVALTKPYRGHRRMTLTFPAFERAGSIVWIVAGTGKASMVERLLAADPAIPAGRVPQTQAVLITDGVSGL
jgi:6-phosphogluconolactonase